MKRWIKQSLFGLLTSMIIGVLFVSYQLGIPTQSSGDSILVDIPKGASSYTIGELLKKKGLIRSPHIFYYYSRITGASQDLRAGGFLIKPSQSLVQIISHLKSDNGRANLMRITIREGLSIWEIGDVLEAKGILYSKDFTDFAHHEAKSYFKKEFPFLADIPVETIEGYLFPDTYYIAAQSSKETITRSMLTQFKRVMMPIWSQNKGELGSPKQRFDFHRVLTVASMIQKEAGNNGEMPLISSVFYNRLQKRMPLGSDPTIVYAHGEIHKKRVYYKHLKIDSPYNTYKYSGFPPSSIASPGKAAFEASLAPSTTPYYFFVADKKTGGHIFTETYRQHLQVQSKP